VSPRVAIELTTTELRAVVASGWRTVAQRIVVVPWNPEAPEAGIAALREQVGGVDAIAIAVGLDLLQVARVELPPAAEEAREGMLSLESARFFATDHPCIVALAPGGAVAFAADAARLERWRVALESWGTIVRIEAAPIALARALGAAGSGEFRLDGGGEERGFVAIRGGRVVAARRIPAALGDAPGSAPVERDGVPGTHLAAWGALLGEDADPRGTLASPEWRGRFARRRGRRLAIAVLAAVAGVTFALLAADRWRERTLRALEADVAARRGAAVAGEAALAARARLDAESAYLAHAGGAAREGTLGALAAISNALPPDAVILSARAVGREWQVEGTAASAASLVPRLDQDGHFEDVRILSASSRFRDGPRTRETFAIALRVRPGT
jgi:hypothetical protein